MCELFIRFLLPELRKAGFLSASYNKECDQVIISPEYARLFVAREDGEYLVHYNEDSRSLVPVIRSVIDTTRSVTAAWSRSKSGEIEGAERFRKLLEWNSTILAARDDVERGLHFVTWRVDYDGQGVHNGYYTNDIADAMRNFTGRSGLIPRDRIFDDTQIDLIRSALAYKLETDGELYPDETEKIKSLLNALEP